MKKITHLLLVLAILFLGTSCQDEEGLSPSLSVEQKLEAFANELQKNPNISNEQVIKIGSKYFQSIELDDSASLQGRAQSNDSVYIIEIDGELYAAWYDFDDDCIHYARIIIPGGRQNYYWNSIC